MEGEIPVAESLTAEEVREKIIEDMPTSVGELYYALFNEVTWLHLKWKDFRALFAYSPERVELLNRVAPTFFHGLQQMVWEDVLLHLCRLTDPASTMGKANLTLRRLADSIPDSDLCSEVQALIKSVKERTKFARDWRNRRLAHKELATSDAKPLEEASRRHVEEALAAIRQVMNCIEKHYQKSHVTYESSIEALGGVESLLRVLRKGLDSERIERTNPPRFSPQYV